ncbi:hypothetical protein QO002_001835 [Pararhizobium capsulatum DSM 1112]|uniref:Uncharacterized protein n=1 Tax=Pararhizobium capsulatum DSM 1112 TaxID=1121113 RepID=A0ABU0BNZ5_9HYPH|nr:hypothetical protein [Pararhizobium capsulatum DSM 1112]
MIITSGIMSNPREAIGRHTVATWRHTVSLLSFTALIFLILFFNIIFSCFISINKEDLSRLILICYFTMNACGPCGSPQMAGPGDAANVSEVQSARIPSFASCGQSDQSGNCSYRSFGQRRNSRMIFKVTFEVRLKLTSFFKGTCPTVGAFGRVAHKRAGKQQEPIVASWEDLIEGMASCTQKSGGTFDEAFVWPGVAVVCGSYARWLSGCGRRNLRGYADLTSMVRYGGTENDSRPLSQKLRRIWFPA